MATTYNPPKRRTETYHNWVLSATKLRASGRQGLGTSHSHTPMPGIVPLKSGELSKTVASLTWPGASRFMLLQGGKPSSIERGVSLLSEGKAVTRSHQKAGVCWQVRKLPQVPAAPQGTKPLLDVGTRIIIRQVLYEHCFIWSSKHAHEPYDADSLQSRPSGRARPSRQ